MPGNRKNKGLKKEGVSLIYDTPSFFDLYSFIRIIRI